MKPRIPTFHSDAEAEAFVAEADLTKFDLSGAVAVHFELQPKTERINMRLPTSLLGAVKAEAARQGVPYQRLIRLAIEHELKRST